MCWNWKICVVLYSWPKTVYWIKELCVELGENCLVACESHHSQSVLKFVVTSILYYIYRFAKQLKIELRCYLYFPLHLDDFLEFEVNILISKENRFMDNMKDLLTDISTWFSVLKCIMLTKLFTEEEVNLYHINLDSDTSVLTLKFSKNQKAI